IGEAGRFQVALEGEETAVGIPGAFEVNLALGDRLEGPVLLERDRLVVTGATPCPDEVATAATTCRKDRGREQAHHVLHVERPFQAMCHATGARDAVVSSPVASGRRTPGGNRAL